MLYCDAIREGTTDPRLNYLIAYGVYLKNGGRKEDFEELNGFDISLIRITDEAVRITDRNKLAENISKIFGGEGD